MATDEKWRLYCVKNHCWAPSPYDGRFNSRVEAMSAIPNSAVGQYIPIGEFALPPKTHENPKAKDSAHKLPLWLVPGVAIIRICEVLDFGRKKPGRWTFNWRTAPIKLNDYTSAMMRHILAIQDGEWLDPETGLPHVAHIAAGASVVIDAEAHNALEFDNQTSQATSKLLYERQAARLDKSP
jgi:hypothetical protein